MKEIFLYCLFCCCSLQYTFSQSEVVTPFGLPIRSSFKYNRYLINPTFSFAREEASYLTFYNKRQWVNFENAPQTYIVSYSGKLNESNAIAVGLFQQNYGVISSFGAIGNYAKNVSLNEESNLTFGVNLVYQKSGLNLSKIVTNSPDPIINSIPSNSNILINPGINYGSGFFDFGVYLSNWFVYNLASSKYITYDPDKYIGGHLMYTSYIESNGFLDSSKFSAQIRTELRKDKTIVSGLAMLRIPSGLWGQVGYNNLYGISGGIGVNISQSIALEYNYERAMGSFANFGASHEIILAYKFKDNNNKYDYLEESSIIPASENRNIQEEKETKPEEDNSNLLAEERAKEEARLRAEALAQEKLLADAKAKEEARLRAEALAQEKLLADAKAKEEARLKAEALAQEKLLADAKAKEEARLKAEALAQEKLLADAKAKEEARLREEALAKEKLLQLNNSKKDTLVTNNPKDKEWMVIDKLANKSIGTVDKQKDLLDRLTNIIAKKESDLQVMKEENDLNEKGIYSAPKIGKTNQISNEEIEALKVEILDESKVQKQDIRDLENLYTLKVKKVNGNDKPLVQYYGDIIQNLKDRYLEFVQSNTTLVQSFEKIKEDTEVEKKRRIKRATFITNEERYNQDMETLMRIKQNTTLSSVPLQQKDFDYGEPQPVVQIIKGVKNIENGYYLVIAVHNDIAKRDNFITKTVASGQQNVNFFYDISSSKYFIYYEVYNSIEEAQKELSNKGRYPYNKNVSIVKIEN